ncbi:MAG TPA: pyridoxamine 5'-phosphate oxidase family protein [Acidimicrobiia bacterium]|nr:pyridoxamine 5'-phosphate oxidase family protein [Acidimicrobiia bacterium]
MATTPDPSAAQSAALLRTRRSAVRRLADRGRYDAATVHAILDEAYIAHVGFVVDAEPRVLPMTYGRIGDALYLHGAAGNAMLRALVDAPVCVTVTILDGLVLARSAFHHSMNYRSVVLFGIAARVEDTDEQRSAFDAIVEHSVRGRSAVARPPTASELRATSLLRVPIHEGAAKVRTGGPNDDEDDLDLPVWAGQVPLRLVAGEPIAEAAQAGRSLAPPAISALTR